VTSRILPTEEWAKLTGTLLGESWESLDPEIDIVLVIEQDDEIVACTSFLPRWHMEGTWISPKYRKKHSVVRRGLYAMYQTAHALGAKELMMVSVDDEVSTICRRLGKSSICMTGDHFSIAL
jgi:N-acetylglutamate synthase-like GNAT family acetyltransferase